MKAPLLLPQVVIRAEASPQADLDLATEGVLRYVWSTPWGDILIEAKDGAVYVNGDLVNMATNKVRTQEGRPAGLLHEDK